MKHLAPILAFVVLLATYHIAGVLWGGNAKLSIVIGMLVLYALLSLALFVISRRLRRDQPELAVILDSDSGAPWHWKLLDGILGVSFAFVPPVMVSVIGGHPLSWESEFTG